MTKEESMPDFQVIHNDCLLALREMEENSVDAICTDPPYGLGFMGKNWDHGVPGVAFWQQALRVLKPGGHLLAFGGSRTYHRLAVAIEDAGFEIRDQVMWLYGSGFPKSLDVSKAIDKAAGATGSYGDKKPSVHSRGDHVLHEGWKRPWQDDPEAVDKSGREYLPATEAARQWQGWGTALKPAHEPIVVARKPLEGTVAENVQRYGTGAINVDGCRIGDEVRFNQAAGNKAGGNSLNMSAVGMPQDAEGREAVGRWPANVIHDGSDEVLAGFPGEGDGSAARFFYCAKASKHDRGEGNSHPTVKPTDLMRYLCRLITPPGGLVLDPFCGSGSTGKAAMLEGFNFIGIECEAEYVEIARARIAAAVKPRPMPAKSPSKPAKAAIKEISLLDYMEGARL